MKSVSSNAMLTVVVDTNIWVSTLIKPRGYYAQLLKEIIDRGKLFTAEEILAEAREVVLRSRIRTRYHLTEALIDRALAEARTYATIVSDLPQINVVAGDPDDNIIVACAIKAKAQYVVSYDPHLTTLKEYQGIKILTPEQFVPILRGSTP
ncbi:putative toxin-antitoxin system toxin component, PIN family [Candidatus Acetothermia bacterium]|nr:putative toxin-antitoxin system toxin component, PIN family [Candidatus Acetothermia bacterium]